MLWAVMLLMALLKLLFAQGFITEELSVILHYRGSCHSGNNSQ
jgi:hypothetical protein